MPKQTLVERIKNYFSLKLIAPLLLAGSLTPGCGAVSFYQLHYPKRFDKPPLEYIVNKEEDKIYTKLSEIKKSPTNKYALLIKGNDRGVYLDGDIKNMAKLLLLKDYDIYYLHPNSRDFLATFCNALGKISDDKTKLFIAMTGHGSQNGFSLALYNGIKNRIKPKYLFETLQKVKGKKAVLIGACHSGIFYNHLESKYWWHKVDNYFNGVLFTACPADSISNSDPFLGMSAFYYGFCNYFAATADEEEDLSKIDFDGKMTPISEFIVSMKKLFGSKDSYDVQIFSTTKFKF